jgi:hypothetical protein
VLSWSSILLLRFIQLFSQKSAGTVIIVASNKTINVAVPGSFIERVKLSTIKALEIRPGKRPIRLPTAKSLGLIAETPAPTFMTEQF